MARRDLFANFERMRREIDELFGDVFERTGFVARQGFSPRIDLYFSGPPPRTVVEADLAGIEPDRVGIEIRGRQLVIAGRRDPQAADDRLYQHIEIERGPFRRVVDLGAEVVADEATAAYEGGILRVEVPLAPPDRSARRVPVSRPQDEHGRPGDWTLEPGPPHG